MAPKKRRNRKAKAKPKPKAFDEINIMLECIRRCKLILKLLKREFVEMHLLQDYKRFLNKATCFHVEQVPPDVKKFKNHYEYTLYGTYKTLIQITLKFNQVTEVMANENHPYEENFGRLTGILIKFGNNVSVMLNDRGIKTGPVEIPINLHVERGEKPLRVAPVDLHRWWILKELRSFLHYSEIIYGNYLKSSRLEGF